MWAQKPCRKPLNCYNTENQCVCVYMCCCLCPLCVCMGLQGKDALTTSACLVKSKKSEWDFQIRFLPKDYDCPVRFSKHSENVQQCVLGTSVSWREKPNSDIFKSFLFVLFVHIFCGRSHLPFLQVAGYYTALWIKPRMQHFTREQVFYLVSDIRCVWFLCVTIIKGLSFCTTLSFPRKNTSKFPDVTSWNNICTNLEE